MQLEDSGKKIKFLVGDISKLELVENVPALPLFSDKAVDFLEALSKEILSNKIYRKYSDVVAFAFWIRKASLEQEALRYKVHCDRIGRGVVFQIAPSNIPVQFAVSMVYSLVAGNVSIVRVSNKEFEQVDAICSAINNVLERVDSDIKKYIIVLRYEHNDKITEYLSSLCDARMIWGGNNTIEIIKKVPLPPRSIELCFANRYSLTVIDSDYLLDTNMEWVINDFYLDTYFSDQNACSSSRIIVWKGTCINEAKKIFWNSLKKKVDSDYALPDIAGSEKLLNTALIAATNSDVKEIRDGNSIVRIECPYVFEGMETYIGNCGYFIECSIDSISKLAPLLKKECQTVTYLDNDTFKDEFRHFVCEYGLRGVDRIVKMGHSMDLSFVWDGYDMPISLSRVISYM